MKTTFKTIALAIALMVTMVQCKKEDNFKGLNIDMATYEVTALNDCSTSAGDGSSITLKLNVPNLVAAEDIYGIKSTFTFSGGTNGESLIRDLSVDLSQKEVSAFRCVRFGSSSTVTYEMQILMKNGDLGAPQKLIVNRPSGAN
jgi:hypothetical protein